jgi:hypothetical protein
MKETRGKLMAATDCGAVKRGYMMASELIAALSAIVAESGDMPVAFWCSEYRSQGFTAPTLARDLFDSGDGTPGDVWHIQLREP